MEAETLPHGRLDFLRLFILFSICEAVFLPPNLSTIVWPRLHGSSVMTNNRRVVFASVQASRERRRLWKRIDHQLFEQRCRSQGFAYFGFYVVYAESAVVGPPMRMTRRLRPYTALAVQAAQYSMTVKIVGLEGKYD